MQLQLRVANYFEFAPKSTLGTSTNNSNASVKIRSVATYSTKETLHWKTGTNLIDDSCTRRLKLHHPIPVV